MNSLRWILGSAIAVTIFAMDGAMPLWAQPESTPDPAPQGGALEPDLPDAFQTYVLPRAFSLEIPEGWVAQGVESDRYAVITNYEANRPAQTEPQAQDVKTEVWLVGERPDTFVNRSIQEIVEKNYVVSNYRAVVVDDLPALRVWMSDLPLEYPYQIVTYVGYASYGTAMIVTHYATPTAETEALIQQVHNSFTLAFQ
jgi:hypothetical protein